MKWSAIVLFLACLCLTAACDDDNAAPPDTTELRQAREHWEQMGFDSYEITQRRNCFCLLGGRPVRLLVFRDSLVSGVNLEDSTALTSDELQWYLTVDQLFDYIADIDPAQVAHYEARYDGTYGFPAYFYVDRSEQIADEEIGFECSDLHPLR
ncbi:MAG: hypothetical protein IH600_16325 [Bacteroidetes bacterium]|nr:hypothetical protein [Bacteroidota bacterium]